MANRIVEAKEFRSEFRRQAVLICDFSQKKLKHCLGIGPRQMSIGLGADVVNAITAAFEADGRTLDKSLIDLRTPKGARRYAGNQLSQLAAVSPAFGGNAIESLWRSFGELIATGNNRGRNVYVAKNGATAVEWASVGDRRSGKTAAAGKRDEMVQDIVAKGRDALGERCTGDAYAQDCAEYFKALPAAE